MPPVALIVFFIMCNYGFNNGVNILTYIAEICIYLFVCKSHYYEVIAFQNFGSESVFFSPLRRVML